MNQASVCDTLNTSGNKNNTHFRFQMASYEETMCKVRGTEIMRDGATYYTVYDSKTKKVIASGNAEECAIKLKMTLHTFYSTVSRVKSRKNKKYEIDISKCSYTDDF